MKEYKFTQEELEKLGSMLAELPYKMAIGPLGYLQMLLQEKQEAVDAAKQ